MKQQELPTLENTRDLGILGDGVVLIFRSLFSSKHIKIIDKI